MRELLFRLMKKLPDGSYEVVGYEKHEGGKIYHAKLLEIVVIDGNTTDVSGWGDISYVYSHDGAKETMFCVHYIPHDRIDQYTGVDVDGVKAFERDIILGTRPIWIIDGYKEKFEGMVAFKNCRFLILCPNHPNDYTDTYIFADLFLIDKDAKIIGIEGVSSKNINTGG